MDGTELENFVKIWWSYYIKICGNLFWKYVASQKIYISYRKMSSRDLIFYPKACLAMLWRNPSSIRGRTYKNYNNLLLLTRYIGFNKTNVLL